MSRGANNCGTHGFVKNNNFLMEFLFLKINVFQLKGFNFFCILHFLLAYLLAEGMMKHHMLSKAMQRLSLPCTRFRKILMQSLLLLKSILGMLHVGEVQLLTFKCNRENDSV